MSQELLLIATLNLYIVCTLRVHNDQKCYDSLDDGVEIKDGKTGCVVVANKGDLIKKKNAPRDVRIEPFFPCLSITYDLVYIWYSTSTQQINIGLHQ